MIGGEAVVEGGVVGVVGVVVVGAGCSLSWLLKRAFYHLLLLAARPARLQPAGRPKQPSGGRVDPIGLR